MSLRRLIFALQILFPLLLGAGSLVYAGTATDISGLMYTGTNTSGVLVSGGGLDGNWDVTYASINNGANYASYNPNTGVTSGTAADQPYVGSAYVVSSSFIPNDYVANTAKAQWITTPGAATTNAGTTVNTGGTFLPGNGNSGTYMGIYVYTLAFTIIGTGSGTVTNKVAISLTVAADDELKIYVNPTGNGQTLPTGTASYTRTSAWTATAATNLANYNGSYVDKGGNTVSVTNNASFKIGTNYLVAVVDNTNNINGTAGSNPLNPSGFMMYQVSNIGFINGQPVPEMAPWMPLAGALGLYGFLCAFRARRQKLVDSPV
jgi:hypothetical protein